MKYFQEIYTKQYNTFFQEDRPLEKLNYNSINKSKQLFVEQVRDFDLLGLIKFIHLQVMRFVFLLFCANSRFIPV